MNIQDSNTVRTAADLERKYNFGKLLGLEKNIESNSGALIKVNNQLNNMLNSLIINLGDVLDSQTDISLWFYTGVPTTSNVPYTNWTTPADHIGDLYYNQSTGYVYKYTSTGWAIQEDQNLISALALTNADIDTQTDHERKVYFTQPIPAYSSGDWWILEDGTLKICQLGKGATDEYDSQDFVVSSKYTSTVATKQGDTITVLQGTVTEITENYVKYTDLGTGGSTTISGDKVKTGKITSNNFAMANNKVSAGTRLDLDNGKLETKNVTLDDDGLKLSNGAKVVGTNGLMNTYIFENEGIVGYMHDWVTPTSNIPSDIRVRFILPEGLNIVSAKVQLIHTPIYWDNGEGTILTWGKSQNVIVKKDNGLYSRTIGASLSSEMWLNNESTNYVNVDGAFGTDGWTPPATASSHITETATSIDIKSSITAGLNQIKITCPDGNQTWDDYNLALRSGYICAIVKIDGYMTYS